MKIFNFFIKNIFLRKIIIVISMILLLFMENYTTFIASRSLFSTVQGYEEIKCMNQNGIYIANLDPNSNIDMDIIKKNKVQEVYDYLHKNFNYSFYTDGFMVSLPGLDGMEVSLSYMNDAYYELNKFQLSQGEDLYFDYEFDKEKEIPILIGKGLSKTYPIGSNIKIEEPILGNMVTWKVVGILKQDAFHSNYYALNLKNYYNFSVFIPVNREFINNASIDLLLNGLMDFAVLKTTKEKTANLSQVIEEKLGLKFYFYSQEENFAYFNEYYGNSLKIIVIITLILLISISCLCVWNSIFGIRCMIKEFTIHLLVGLSDSKLRNVFYGYFGILFSLNFILLFIITAWSRYGCWLRKDSASVTYGFLGLIGMDWFALGIVFFTDLVIGKIVVGKMLRKIKKIPISVGVLK